MAVHILGNSTNMTELIKISKNKNLQIIEDTYDLLVQNLKINLSVLLEDLEHFLFTFHTKLHQVREV